MNLTFGLECFNVLIFISVLFTLIGSALGASDQIDFFKPLQRIFARDVLSIDQGLQQLSDFTHNPNEITLGQKQTGFNQILEIIKKNDKFAPEAKIVEISHRKDFVEKFYWAQKAYLGTIFLKQNTKATTQDEVYPVSFSPTVFNWVTQERTRILTTRGFVIVFWGTAISLLACFIKIGI